MFDKTGTLTRAEFRVSSHHLFPTSPSLISPESLFKVISTIEETSLHPISLGLGTFCRNQAATDEAVQLLLAEEVPGRGISATVRVCSATFDVLIGNERLLDEQDTVYESDVRETCSALVARWAREGNSVVLIALRPALTNPPSPFVIAGLFAVNDPPREEAPLVILELERQGIAVFLLTGDNAVTALAVAKKVGIAEDRVFADVLPIGKRDAIEMLQRGAASDAIAAVRLRRESWWRRRKNFGLHAKVLFVGDGVSALALFLSFGTLTSL